MRRCFGHQRTLGEEARVEALEVPEQFVLWAMRRWADDWRRGEPSASHLADGFGAAALEPDVQVFVDWLGVLAVGAYRPLDLRRVTCSAVAPDEAALLDALAAWQRGRADLAVAGLSELAAAAAVRIASAHGAAFACALRDSGLDLPLRDLPARAMAASMRTAQAGLSALQ